MQIKNIIEDIKSKSRILVTLQEENKIVKLITKGLILGKSNEVLATDIIEGYGNVNSVPEIVQLIREISSAIKKNSNCEFDDNDKMHAEKIIMNLLNKDPNLKISELMNDVKVALATRGHEDVIRELIETKKPNHIVDIESIGFDPRFNPKRKDSYIIEEKKGDLIAVMPSHSKPSGYVIGFGRNKFFFLGYKDGIIKQEYTRNIHRIKLIHGLAPGNRKFKKLTGKEVVCKNVPIEEIPDSLADQIRKFFVKDKDEIIIGAALSGNRIRRINGELEIEAISMSEFMDDAQSRIAVTGSPGNGKTVLANYLQKQIMLNKSYLQGGTVTIAKDVPHLTNGANKFISFGKFFEEWDEDKVSDEFLGKVNLGKIQNHKRIVISSEDLIPDLNKLSKETIIALVRNSSCSDQVKDALCRNIEESDDVVTVLTKAREGELLGEEYMSSQDNALKRLMNSIIPANYKKIRKVDIKKTLKDFKHVAFFIKGLNGDSFATMILWELYSLEKSKGIVNPVLEGRLLTIDECQKFNRHPAFKDIFQRLVLDARNFGICMLTIFQDPKQAEKDIGYPDFVSYHTSLEAGKRIASIRDKIVMIPPVAPEVA